MTSDHLIFAPDCLAELPSPVLASLMPKFNCYNRAIGAGLAGPASGGLSECIVRDTEVCEGTVIIHRRFITIYGD